MWRRCGQTDERCHAASLNALAEQIVGLHERPARAFDADCGRSLSETTRRGRVAGLLPTGGSILDVGCGSGEPIARDLIERDFKLTGLDAVPTLISLCRLPPGRGRTVRLAQKIYKSQVTQPVTLEGDSRFDGIGRCSLFL